MRSAQPACGTILKPMAGVETKEKETTLSVDVLLQPHGPLKNYSHKELQDGVIGPLLNIRVKTVEDLRALGRNTLKETCVDPLGPLVYDAFSQPSPGLCFPPVPPCAPPVPLVPLCFLLLTWPRVRCACVCLLCVVLLVLHVLLVISDSVFVLLT